jgi:choline-sulfatase
MRAESLGCYGHNVSKTPNFDKFADEGTRFDQAHVSYTVCSQSRVSFMTAWPTHVRGHRTLFSLLHEWEPNLLKYLKQDNYTVMWWGKNDLLAKDSFNTSVNSARSMGGGNYGANNYSLEDPEFYSFLNKPHNGNYTTTADYKNVYAAIEFLNSERASANPFMIFLPLSYPHPPYSCPEPFYSSINPDDLPDLRKIPN